MKVKYAIIGAGPTGLGAAYRLRELGTDDFVVLEQSGYPGGLAASFVDDRGFTWDIGGHVQFSHYRYFDELMEKALGKEGWLHHQRESWVWIEDRFVPYPFQNNIRYLPQASMWRCLEGVIDANRQPAGNPADFREWIITTFGQGIADIFMLPYNYKVWAWDPSKMSYKWIGERVAVTDLKKVTKNVVFGEDDFSWGPNNTFRFPAKGGTGSVWKAVAELAGYDRFRFHTSAEKIDGAARKIITGNGEEIHYEHLLSTMPLDVLAQRTSGLPEPLVSLAGKLMHSTSHIVGVGLKGRPKEELKTKCWMYFPESNCPFYRVTVFSNYSPANVPDIREQWSLMTETSESPDKPVNASQLVEETIQGLLNTKLISSREEVVSVWHYTAEYGYPTPSVDRDSILAKVLPELEKLSVYSRGRFGCWKYEVSNQDHSLMQGVEWANRMELGIPELTCFFPATANANWGRQ
jgi:protoporphyrinogen oxidase